MEQIVNLHIEKLPEGVYLATSVDLPGLVAQGRTIQETLEIARDVAKKLLEARAEHAGAKRSGKLKPTKARCAPYSSRWKFHPMISCGRNSDRI